VIDETTRQAQLGDRTAQARLLRELQDPWYRMSLSLLRDPEKARDATQETALRFLKLLPRFEGNSTLTTWSMGIVINVVREMRRKLAKPDAAIAGSDDSACGFADALTVDRGPEHRASQVEQATLLRAGLDELPDRQREAIVLRFFEEKSVEEAAIAMNCAPGTVKATVHQALRALRNKLKQLS
jgi:RNA polymerase sigma-70 factor (ECF subfamily)